MIVNKKLLLWVAGFIIFMAFSSQYIWNKAYAQEYLLVEDGNYQVELSFSSLESEQQESFFSKEATLIVKNGLYQLSLKMVNSNIIKDVQILQVGKELPAKFNQTENLVQFDIPEITLPFTITGTSLLSSEENASLFTEHVIIFIDSLIENESDTEEETAVDQSKKEWTLDFVLLEDRQNKPSIMNTYVNPTAEIIEIAGKYCMHMTILKPHWVTSITMEQEGEQLEPTLISHAEDQRVVQFEIKDFKTSQRLYVIVDIPELAYHHQYFVNLQFNQEQVSTFLGESLDTEKPVQPEAEDLSQDSTQVKQTTPVKELTQLLTPSIPTTKTLFTLPEEPRLAFDRTLDEEIGEVTEEAQQEKVVEEIADQMPMTDNAKSQLAQLDKLKILLLLIICLLSGFMFIRRLKNSKQKNSTD